MMTSAHINGIDLAMVEKGSGDPLIFVHGSVSDHRTWQVQLEAFASDYHVIAYSRRYHWPNQQIEGGADYAMTEQVDDLQVFLSQLNLGPVHLVGHSYGAFLCLLLAMRAPELVRSLVLAEAPAITLYLDLPPKPQHMLKLLLTQPAAALTIMKFAATGLVPATSAFEKDDIETGVRLFGNATLGSDSFSNLSAERLEQVHANLIKAEFIGSGFSPLNPDEVRRIQTPTLLINGENSPPLFKMLTKRLDDLLPHSEHVVIPAASHISHEDNPAAYNRAVLGFLQVH
jgi:pimeloyl-ACP methyl ester carboxylesterase